jgi:hypothetical protein
MSDITLVRYHTLSFYLLPARREESFALSEVERSAERSVERSVERSAERSVERNAKRRGEHSIHSIVHPS